MPWSLEVVPGSEAFSPSVMLNSLFQPDESTQDTAGTKPLLTPSALPGAKLQVIISSQTVEGH